jgi:hypothetical protein
MMYKAKIAVCSGIHIIHSTQSEHHVEFLNGKHGGLREERRLRVFENRVLRRVFGPKRDEAKGNGESYTVIS